MILVVKVVGFDNMFDDLSCQYEKLQSPTKKIVQYHDNVGFIFPQEYLYDSLYDLHYNYNDPYLGNHVNGNLHENANSYGIISNTRLVNENQSTSLYSCDLVNQNELFHNANQTCFEQVETKPSGYKGFSRTWPINFYIQWGGIYYHDIVLAFGWAHGSASFQMSQKQFCTY